MTQRAREPSVTPLRACLARLILGALALATACTSSVDTPDGRGTRAEDHQWFPIQTGGHALGRALVDGTMTCESCHDPSKASFTEFTCVDCHSHPREITQVLHGAMPDYSYTSEKCYSCHADGAPIRPFLHTYIGETACKTCHEPGALYAALPKEGVDHAAIVALPADGGPDCGACHETQAWTGARRVPAGAFDPARSVTITGLIPTYSGAAMAALTPQSQTLPMTMNHDSVQLPAATREACAGCHAGAAQGNYRQGELHASLARLGVPQPTACIECHSVAQALPKGFVGPTDAERQPPSGGMKHDAVQWQDGAPTNRAGTPQECSLCHITPTAMRATWATSRSGTTPALFHASLSAAQVPQPGSCIDCHANSRPQDVLTSANATLPAGAAWSFDHTAPETVAECATCHGASASSSYRSWSGGRFHLPNTTTPARCNSCHEGDRPTSTAGWRSPDYQRSPFDYVTNERAIPHGAALDCAECHTGTSSWQGGRFSHDPVTSLAATTCRDCHTTQRPDRLPGLSAAQAAALLNGFDHSVSGTGECKGCHGATVTAGRYVDLMGPGGMLPGGDWRGATNTPSDAFDPARSVVVESLIPSYAGTSIVSLSPQTQTLPMHMDHGTSQVPPAILTQCDSCHPNAAAGEYYPGDLHSSLGNLGIAQPTDCTDCHTAAAPVGLVGPLATNPVRSPSSGEMKHDAVSWTRGAPTNTSIVTQDCRYCHVSPTAQAATWGNDLARATPAKYHPALTTAALPQPTSCVDCHANSRPTTVVSLANGIRFDHATPEAQADCASCHTASWTSWDDGVYHHVGSTTPSTCVPCHEGQRPTSTAGWRSTTFAQAPFDYATHGYGQDCVTCHAGPGTNGTWGTPTQSFVGGHFAHGAGTTAASTCIVCHETQRPDLLPGTTPAAMAALIGFDHAASGTGDCFGCHQATVSAGRYSRYFNVATGMLPNGDWMGGRAYPGSALVTSPNNLVSVTELFVQRGPPNNLVRGVTAVPASYHNAMLHTAAAIPAQVAPGPDSNPDYNGCWHCHQNVNGVVTNFADGEFHSALTNYRATPGGAITPLPQPTSGCNDCHAQQRPLGIVQRAGSNLRPMDHDILFTTPVTVNGRLANGVAAIDCATCHDGVTTWDDGQFHPNVGSAMPVDCTDCHYPLMADTALSDRVSGRDFSMRHASAQLPMQTCITCHTGALAPAATADIRAAAFAGGELHPNIGVQPRACLDCHSNSEPTGTTQSGVVYTLPTGGTPTNGGQWMSHTSPQVAGRECATCHAADARSSGAAWSLTTSFHTAVPDPATCRECHGLTNGNGTTIGTRNNYPAGLTPSNMVSTVAGDPTTGVPAGTRATIDHADVNVTSHDCDFCHTQVGPSTVPAVRGREWAAASFHPNFTGAQVLVMNGTTGRCSNCHMNVRPGAGYAAQDHSAFTATSQQDCSSCHSLPGLGTLIAPNWEGAAGMPQFISVGGFTIPRPPAAAAGTTQRGINNLPHPPVAMGVACTTCHATAGGGRQAFGYDHGSPLIDNSCNPCHEAGSDLVGTPWNGATNEVNGAGDTRPYTLTSVTTRYDGSTIIVNWPNHFYPVDCKECHLQPLGNGFVTTGTAYRTNTGAWGNRSASTSRNFPHNERMMTRPSTCLMCHNPIPD